jgi:hypothetical protein
LALLSVATATPLLLLPAEAAGFELLEHAETAIDMIATNVSRTRPCFRTTENIESLPIPSQSGVATAHVAKADPKAPTVSGSKLSRLSETT